MWRPGWPRCGGRAGAARAAYIAYPTEIDGGRLHPDCFEVSERSVTGGHRPPVPIRAPERRLATTWLSVCRWMVRYPIARQAGAASWIRSADARATARQAASPARHRIQVRGCDRRQVRDVHAATGAVLSPFDEPLDLWRQGTGRGGFSQRVFHNPETGDTLPSTSTCQLTSTGHGPIRWC